MIEETARLARSTESKIASSVATVSGAGVSRTTIFVARPSVPSEPMNAPRRSYPRASATRPPSQTTSSRCHHLEPEHMVRCHAKRQAVRAAGVFRHVAANRAGLLAAWIGSVEQPEMRHRFRNLDVRYARLDHRNAVRGVDLEDAPHSRGGDDDSTAMRHRTAAQPRARPSRSHWQLKFVAEADNSGGLIRPVRKDHRVRPLRFHRAIEFVNDQVFKTPQHVPLADDLR